ncbi:cytochrome c family protein, partial [Desulfovibrio sp. OttesenSCG-928-I05]|nr:cytochrome c family protein [Desulfovibrio sp. OttesenSCG-928-I05]
DVAANVPPNTAAGSGAGMASMGIRPSLKVAYHQQCMSCHQRMDITYPADTDCTACHSKRAPAS